MTATSAVKTSLKQRICVLSKLIASDLDPLNVSNIGDFS